MIGNQNAAKPMRLVSDMLRRLAVQEPHRLRAACEKLFDRAGEDVAAFREIADRIEGKVQSNDNTPSIKVVIIREEPQPIDAIAERLDDA